MATSSDAPASRPRWLLPVMILVSVGYAALFAFSLLGALMSPMVFDSGESPKLWSAFFAFLFFPILILISATFSWCGFGFQRYWLIPAGVALPIMYAVIFWMSFS